MCVMKIFKLPSVIRKLLRRSSFQNLHDCQQIYHFTEEKYRLLFNSGNDAIYLHELDGRFIEINDIACRMLGYTREEFMNMTILDLDDPEVSVDPAILDQFRKEGFLVAQMVHCTKNGSRIPVELSSRILDIEGKKMVLTFARDIRERFMSQEKIRRSHLELKKLYIEAQEKATRIAATNKIVSVISMSLNFKETLQAFSQEITRLIDFDYMSIGVLEGEDQLSLYPVLKTDSETVVLHEVLALTAAAVPIKTVLESGKPIVINDSSVSRNLIGYFKHDKSEFKSNCLVPLNYKGAIIGTFCLGSKESDKYSDKDLGLMESLADHLAVAVQNSRLHERVQELAVILERNRIANEIHDSSVQVFAYFRAKGELIEKMLEKGYGEEALSAAREIQVVAGEAYTEAREAIHALSDKIPVGQSLHNNVQDYLNKLNERWKIKIKCITAENLPFLERKVELQVQRIIQEALANVRKHAKAKHVFVRFDHKENCLTVEVEDDGVGCDLDEIPENTFGFRAMKERAEDIGGKLIIQSKEGLGTRVLVRVPIG